MSEKIYIKRDETIRGPISPQKLQHLVKNGKIRSGDFVRDQEDGEWQTLEAFTRRDEASGSIKPNRFWGVAILVGVVVVSAAAFLITGSKDSTDTSTIEDVVMSPAEVSEDASVVLDGANASIRQTENRDAAAKIQDTSMTNVPPAGTSSAKIDVRQIFEQLGGSVSVKTGADGAELLCIRAPRGEGQKTQVTDEQLNSLSSLTEPFSLTLDSTAGWTKDGLAAAADSGQLDELSLRNCRHVTAEFLTVLPVSLTSLSLEATSVTDAGTAELKRCSRLKTLTLYGAAFRSETASAISGLSNLEKLTIQDCGFGADSYALIGHLQKLIDVRIEKSRLTDNGMEGLAACRTIEKIHLIQCPNITDASLAHFAALPNLTQLTLRETDISSDAILAFEKPRPKLGVSYAASASQLAKAKLPPAAKMTKPLVVAKPETPVTSGPPTEPLATAVTVQGVANKRPKYGRDVDRQIKEQIAKYKDALLKIGAEDSLIVVGKVSLAGIEDAEVPSRLAVQCEVLKDGHFVTAVADPTKPILLGAHGFQPVSLTLPNHLKNGSVMHLAPTTLSQHEEEMQRIITGTVKLIPLASNTLVVVQVMPNVGAYLNTPFNEREFVGIAVTNSHIRQLEFPLRSGRIRIEDCAAMPYAVHVIRDGYGTASADFNGTELTPSRLDLRSVTPVTEPEIRVSSLKLDDFPGKLIADSILPAKQRADDRNSAFSPSSSSVAWSYVFAGRLRIAGDAQPSPNSLFLEIDQSPHTVNIDENGWFSQRYPCDSNTGRTDPVHIYGMGIEPIVREFALPDDRLCLVDVILPTIAEERQASAEIQCFDSRGESLSNAKIRFGVQNVGRYYAQRTNSHDLLLTTNSNGKASIKGLAPGWYRWQAEYVGLNTATGKAMVHREGKNTHVTILNHPRKIQLDVVTAANGSGVFKGNGLPMQLTENEAYHYDRVGANGRAERGYLLAASTSEVLQFRVDSNDGAWIVDVGEIDFKDVKTAKGIIPKPTVFDVAGNGYPNSVGASAKCALNHVYVMKTADNKYLKFKVTKIDQP